MYKIIFLFLTFAFITGCNKKNKISSEPVIVSISISRLRNPGETPFSISDEKISIFIKKASSDSELYPIKLNGRSRKPFSLELTWTLRPVSEIRPRKVENQIHDRAIEISTEIVLRPLFSENAPEILKGTGEYWQTFSKLSPGDLSEKLINGFKQTINTALLKINLENKLLSSPSSYLKKKLESESPETRILTIEIIGKRNLKDCEDNLIAILKSEKYLSIKLRASAVLGMMKSRKAVESVSELALMVSEEHAIALMNVLGNIGGKKAKTFLLWMENGHSSKQIRSAASNILKRHFIME
ncbi:MAG: HEAT repeat domain-containing protein [Deltaproteobacteria bacterium]|nr:HEAT repeat domain-containing protein [Deltaproteobacteria bacterium]